MIRAFPVLVTVFFFWGFVAASNGVFIPFCKEHFSLNQFESQLIDTAFYAAYFVGSLVLWLTARIFRVDFLNRIGYGRGIIYGLILSSCGALMMVPSLNSGSFGLILFSLFVIALGFSLQQTAAQPFVVALGDPDRGAQRLTFAQGINSFGTLLGPLIMSAVLFGDITGQSTTGTSVSSIDTMYYVLTLVFFIAIVVLSLAKLPRINTSETITDGMGALKFSKVRLGMLAIFVYVGVEVTIQSNMGSLLMLPEFGGYGIHEISPFIALYWGSLMIGRWTGAIGLFKVNRITKIILGITIPFVAFALILLVNHVKGNNIEMLYPYILCVAVLVIAGFFSGENPARMLVVFFALAIISMLTGLMTTGKVAMFAFISGGLWCSIGWPCIFALTISGLGKYTSQASALLVMMILGGAIIPPIQGWVADQIGIHNSYWIPVLCFGYLLWFGRKMEIISVQPVN